MNNELPPLIPDIEQPKPVIKEKHKFTLTIEDIDLDTNSIDVIVKHEPDINQNVPMTAALSVAQQVLELLTVIREKSINSTK